MVIVPAVLAKSPIVVKVASGEPLFASASARSFHDVDPRLAAAVLVTHSRRNDTGQAIRHGDGLGWWGNGRSGAAASSGPTHRFVEHGQKGRHLEAAVSCAPRRMWP
jgi:hypothetical protein